MDTACLTIVRDGGAEFLTLMRHTGGEPRVHGVALRDLLLPLVQRAAQDGSVGPREDAEASGSYLSGLLEQQRRSRVRLRADYVGCRPRCTAAASEVASRIAAHFEGMERCQLLPSSTRQMGEMFVYTIYTDAGKYLRFRVEDPTRVLWDGFVEEFTEDAIQRDAGNG